MKIKIIALIIFTSALIGFLIYNNLHSAKAIPASTAIPTPGYTGSEEPLSDEGIYDYTIPTPIVTVDQAGRTNKYVTVVVTWQMPDNAPLDAYGFLIEKEGPVGRGGVPDLFPYERGVGALTNGGFYQDEAAVIGDTYTYYIQAYDRRDKRSDWGSAKITLHGIEISNISVANINANSATISWETDGETQGKVDYGLTTNYDKTSSTTARNFQHSVDLTGLEANKTYHFKIKVFPPAEDNENSWSLSDDKTFKTTTTPFEITITSTNTTPITADISYATSYSATTKFEYRISGSNDPYQSTTTTANVTHNVHLDSLMPSQDYEFKITATNTDDPSIVATKQGSFTTLCPTVNNVKINNISYIGDETGVLPPYKVDYSGDNYPNYVLSWESNYDVNGKLYYRKYGSSDSWKEASFSGMNPSVSLSDLPNSPSKTTYEVNLYSTTTENCHDAIIFTAFPHVLTLKSQEDTSISLLWRSYAPTKGTITIPWTSNDYGTIKIDNPTTNLTLNNAFPFAEFYKAIYDHSGYNLNSVFALRNLDFEATPHAVTADGAPVESAPGTNGASFVKFSLISPFNCMTYSAPYVFPNQINATITSGSANCTPPYALKSAAMEYSVTDNVGGQYVKMVSQSGSGDFIGNTTSFTISDVPVSYSYISSLGRFAWGNLGHLNISVVLPKGQVVSLPPIISPDWSHFDSRAGATAVSPYGNDAFRINYDYKIYFGYGVLYYDNTKVQTRYGSNSQYLSYKYYIGAENSGQSTNIPTAAYRDPPPPVSDLWVGARCTKPILINNGTFQRYLSIESVDKGIDTRSGESCPPPNY